MNVIFKTGKSESKLCSDSEALVGDAFIRAASAVNYVNKETILLGFHSRFLAPN